MAYQAPFPPLSGNPSGTGWRRPPPSSSAYPSRGRAGEPYPRHAPARGGSRSFDPSSAALSPPPPPVRAPPPTPPASVYGSWAHQDGWALPTSSSPSLSTLQSSYHPAHAAQQRPAPFQKFRLIDLEKDDARVIVFETGWPRWVDLAAALEEMFQLPTTALRLAYHSPVDGEEIVLASARELEAMFCDLREAGLGLEFQPVRLLVQRRLAVKGGPERGRPGRSVEWDEQRVRESRSRADRGRREGWNGGVELWVDEWERKPEAGARNDSGQRQNSGPSTWRDRYLPPATTSPLAPPTPPLLPPFLPPPPATGHLDSKPRPPFPSAAAPAAPTDPLDLLAMRAFKIRLRVKILSEEVTTLKQSRKAKSEQWAADEAARLRRAAANRERLDKSFEERLQERECASGATAGAKGPSSVPSVSMRSPSVDVAAADLHEGQNDAYIQSMRRPQPLPPSRSVVGASVASEPNPSVTLVAPVATASRTQPLPKVSKMSVSSARQPAARPSAPSKATQSQSRFRPLRLHPTVASGVVDKVFELSDSEGDSDVEWVGTLPSSSAPRSRVTATDSLQDAPMRGIDASQTGSISPSLTAPWPQRALASPVVGSAPHASPQRRIKSPAPADEGDTLVMVRFATGQSSLQALASSRAALAGARRRAPSPPLPRLTRAATDQPVAGPIKRGRCSTPTANRQPRKKVKAEASSSLREQDDSVPRPDERRFAPLENAAFEHWRARNDGHRRNNNKLPFGYPLPPLVTYHTEFELSVDFGVELVLQCIEDRFDGAASDDDGSPWASAMSPRAGRSEDDEHAEVESVASQKWWDDDSFLEIYRHLRPDRGL